MTDTANTKVEKVFNRFAPRYDRQIELFEKFVLGRARQWAVAQARGRVVEIAVGSGLNLPLYGTGVTSVVGVDLSEGMLEIARRRVAEEGLENIELQRGDVQQLDLPDTSADTVLSTYTFCTIPDPERASREALRVLRPGGSFILAEHGPSTHRAIGAVMRVVDPISVFLGADHITRDPVGYLLRTGFVIDEISRTGRGSVVFRIVARKPA